ncbi:hypothetical protein AFLA_006617 [Aspergillus flavus NRRL3357]|nr:hypothetical protein AFLA_006617 [Aspergillus flavus NRRL3357]
MSSIIRPHEDSGLMLVDTRATISDGRACLASPLTGTFESVYPFQKGECSVSDSCFKITFFPFILSRCSEA